MTLFEYLKDTWIIKMKDLKSMGIDPNKKWADTTVSDLYIISDFLDVTVSDLF